MVDFERQEIYPESDYEQSLNALSLYLAVPFNYWPNLSDCWERLGHEVRNLLQNIDKVEAVAKSSLIELLKPTVGNLILLRTCYHATQTAKTEEHLTTSSKLFGLYRTRGQRLIADLEQFVKNTIIDPLANLDIPALQRVVLRVRYFHDKMCGEIETAISTE
jgi:hypothetical protein